MDSYSKKVKVLQLKTKEDVTIDLNLSAITLLGQRGGMEESVFKLPSHTGCLKSLKNWKEAAGIEKNITWHCGRHSFAVNLLYFNNDIKTVSSLLGHKRLRHTEKYTRAVSELKEKAVNSLPALKFD